MFVRVSSFSNNNGRTLPTLMLNVIMGFDDVIYY